MCCVTIRRGCTMLSAVLHLVDFIHSLMLGFVKTGSLHSPMSVQFDGGRATRWRSEAIDEPPVLPMCKNHNTPQGELVIELKCGRSSPHKTKMHAIDGMQNLLTYRAWHVLHACTADC